MMPSMRTTVRIDDELLEALKEQARKEKISLTRLLDRTLRAGLRGPRPRRTRLRHRERPQAMGVPRVNLDKALAIAAALEDEATLEKLQLRK
jgi:hypothetical protein